MYMDTIDGNCHVTLSQDCSRRKFQLSLKFLHCAHLSHAGDVLVLMAVDPKEMIYRLEAR